MTILLCLVCFGVGFMFGIYTLTEAIKEKPDLRKVIYDVHKGE